jgi:glycosyltransferase involved in cell wall biosynthesis
VGKNGLKILVVTNLYPTQERPCMCPFVKEQVETMREVYRDLTIDVRVIEGERPRGAYLLEMLRLPGIVKRGRYDLVHAHFGLTLVSTLFVRLPVVVTLHGSDVFVNPTKHLTRLLAPRSAKVIVVARRLKEALGYGEIIPCGIDVRSFFIPSYRANRPGPEIPGELKVLFPADPARKIKNYGLFKAVCQELEKRGNRIKPIHLVNINRANVPEVYWNSDLMLLTSLSEGSPTVIKEAIAAKLPFVSVDVGDVKEWAEQVDFGVVASDRKPKSIADAAVSLMSRIKQRQLLDNTNCLEVMNIENTAKKVRRIYDDIFRMC